MICRRHLVLLSALAPLIAASAQAAVFYTQTVPRTPLGGDPVGAEFAALDDIQVHEAAQNPFHLPMNITKVTYGIVQNPGATAMTLTGYYGNTLPDADADFFPEIDPPIVSFGTANVPAYGGAVPQIYNAVIGDGIATLFTVSPDFNDHIGFGQFALGLLFSADNTGNIWGLVDPGGFIDENLDGGAWFYDFTLGQGFSYALTDIENNPIQTTFLVTVEGELVPEPASIGLLGIAGIGLLGRRRRV